MSELRYCDIASYKVGIFSKIDLQLPDQFGNMGSSQLDMAFYGLYSKRYVAPLVDYSIEEHPDDNDAVLTELAEIVCGMFKSKWLRLVEALTVEYDMLSTTFEEYEGNDTYHRESKSSQLDKNAVYGFDSSDPSEDSKAEGETSTTGDDVSSKKYTIKGRQGGKSPQQLISSEWELRQRNLVREIFRDVADTITLPIY